MALASSPDPFRTQFGKGPGDEANLPWHLLFPEEPVEGPGTVLCSFIAQSHPTGLTRTALASSPPHIELTHLLVHFEPKPYVR